MTSCQQRDEMVNAGSMGDPSVVSLQLIAFIMLSSSLVTYFGVPITCSRAGTVGSPIASMITSHRVLEGAMGDKRAAFLEIQGEGLYV